MTTVVCNRTSMAADRRIAYTSMFKSTKIFRVRGSLIGVAGNLEQALRFIEWRKAPQDMPVFIDAPVAFEALELTQEGKLVWWGTELVGIPIDDEYYAIGSGAACALGAMAMGATPKQAIKVAAKWDSATGVDVQTMTLGSK